MTKIEEFYDEYIKKRSIEWPFIKLLLSPNSTINDIFNEIVINFDSCAHNNNFSYESYTEHLDDALGIFYDINDWVKDSLGKNDIDKFIDDDNMDQYVDTYTKFWFHQEFTLEQLQSSFVKFPNNIESLLPKIIDYIKCPFLDSKIISWSLIDIIAFKELKAFSSSTSFHISITDNGVLSSIFNNKRKDDIKKCHNLLNRLYSIYLQCNQFMFHPKVISEICLDIRKTGDYYDGIMFELLDQMIAKKQYHISY